MRVQILSLAAMSTVVALTGCCGPKQGRSAMHRSGSSTSAYADTSDSSRTYVSDEVGAQKVEGDGLSLQLYSESLRVGKREVDNGNVRLRKTVRTENASQPVELKRETVTIDREAFEGAQRSAESGQPNQFGAAFEQKEIVIELKREEPVVEVQPYISGKITAQKRSTMERQDVQRQVRRESVEIIKNADHKDIIVSERVMQEQGAPNNPQNNPPNGAPDGAPNNDRR